MKIIIKGIGKLKVNQNLQGYIEEKIRKYENLVKEPAVCEVALQDLRGPKNGIDKAVTIRMTLPKVKNPIFVKEVTSDFFGSIDLAQERLEQKILKYKERKKIGMRFPAKYWLSKVYEKSLLAPRLIFRKIRKRNRP